MFLYSREIVFKIVFTMLSTILLPFGNLYAKESPSTTYANHYLQKLINENSTVVINKGVYKVNDSYAIQVPSDRRIIFRDGALIHFVNAKGKQFESVIEVKGDNVSIEGLQFSSNSYISRRNYGNSTRNGESSLCTVIRCFGDNITIKNTVARNADIVVSIARGKNIKVDNLKAECFQAIYAQNCSDISIRHVETTLNKSADRLDHHLYFKASVNNISIKDCHFIGGNSFAMQFSGDYSNMTVCPRNVYIEDVIMTDVSYGIVIDKGNSNVFISNMKAQADIQPDCFFLSNRGGCITISKSVIRDFSRIELETISNEKGSRGNSTFENCDFIFTVDKARAFELYYLDSLSITNCNFIYKTSPTYDGCVVKTEKAKDAVGNIIFTNNNVVMSSSCNYLIRIPTQKTKMIIEECSFHNLSEKKSSLFYGAETSNVSVKRIKVSNINPTVTSATESKISRGLLRKYKKG